MKTLVVIALFALTAGAAQVRKSCTTEPKDKWMAEVDFKKMVEDQGYTIKNFKESGTCYEISGTDKSGKKVDLYFNPVDGSVATAK